MAVDANADEETNTKRENRLATKWGLLLAGLQIADLLTTQFVLKRMGASAEKNPLARVIYRKFGFRGLAAFKSIGVLGALRHARKEKASLSLFTAVVFYVFVVVSNFLSCVAIAIFGPEVFEEYDDEEAVNTDS